MSKVSQRKSVELSVVMPAYNEGVHIYANILKVCDALKGSKYEVIVVDDGSRDKTFDESQRAAWQGLPVKVVRQETNRGKGAALFRGFNAASGKLIAFLDADLEIAPQEILRLRDVMNETEAEVVVGVKDPLANKFPYLRRVLSGRYRQVVSFLFGLSITDTQTGAKLFKRQVLEAVIPRLSVSRFAFDIELLVAASRFGYIIAEHPVKITFRRTGGLGRMRLRHLVGMFLDLLTIYFRASFWRWLEPSLATQLWMLIFVLGVFLFGVGVGKVLTPIILQPPIRQVFYFVALQFLPATLRDWLLVLGGMLMVVLALIQLNKSLLNAFARRDRGDLAGIFRK